jgi:NCS1 family nucleobase:cation symporter-1
MMSNDDVIEARSFDFVPEGERQGSIWGQAQLWFMVNATLITLYTGAVGALYKLDLIWTIVAIIAGSIFGTLFQAFHGAQGPRMGLPQMIQSRVQFGSRGAVLPLVAATLCQFGFAIFYIQTGTQALSGVTGLGSLSWTQGLFGIAAMLVAIVGYKLVLKIEKIVSYATILNLIFLTIAAVSGLHFKDMLSGHHFMLVPFLAQFGASAAYQIAIAPMVSDYTRYLPSKINGAAVSAAVFFGTLLSAVWLEGLGAALTTAFPQDDVIVSIHNLGNGFGFALGSWTMLIATVTCLITCAIAFYSGTVAILSAAEAYRPIHSSIRLRAWTVIIGGTLTIIAGLLISDNTLASFSAFLSILGYFLIPWTAVNLTDYYFVRRGVFSITDIMNPDGGMYGRWGRAGIASYLLGFVSMIPFFSNAIYTGPVALYLDKADTAPIVGLIASALIYLFLMRGFDRNAERMAVSKSPLNTID